MSFKLILQIDVMSVYLEIALIWRLQNPQVNIDSGNGFVPSGNKPLHESMFTQIFVALWHHYTTVI